MSSHCLAIARRRGAGRRTIPANDGEHVMEFTTCLYRSRSVHGRARRPNGSLRSDQIRRATRGQTRPAYPYACERLARLDRESSRDRGRGAHRNMSSKKTKRGRLGDDSAFAAGMPLCNTPVAGWPVFPLHSVQDGRCTCGRDCGKNAGKHPRVKGGFKAATTDARQIEAWWRKWPNANIGIATGAVSGIIVIDIDGAERTRNSAILVAQHGTLPRTAIVKTARGWHLYFAMPANMRRRFHAAPATGSMCEAMADTSSRLPRVTQAATSINGASMLADAPLWLQDWARSRQRHG